MLWPTDPRPYGLRDSVAHFARAEDGAVTVDWVVLCGALVGLGLAVIAVVSGGLESLSGEVAQSLAGTEIITRFDTALENLGSAFLDFADGDTGSFSGGELASLGGLGDVYQIGPDGTAGASFDLPPGTAEAVVEFDLLGLDTLNSEPATVTVNGQVAGIVTVDNGTATFTAVNGGSSNFEAFTASSGSDLNGNGAPDAHTQVRVTVANPGETLDVQIHSGASADTGNESYAVDNFRLSSS